MVAIMYVGEIVEFGPIREIYNYPRHPYTIGLFQSIPSLDENVERLIPIPRLMSDPTDLPSGCPFWSRCARAEERCRKSAPPVSEKTPGHFSKCFRAN